MLLEAGYSESVADQQSVVLIPLRAMPEAQEVAKNLKGVRDKILERVMDEKRMDTASWKDLALALDRIIRNIELLSGRETERIGGTHTRQLDDIEAGIRKILGD